MKEFKQIIDISWPIESGMVVYPKNPAVRLQSGYRGKRISKLSLGSHTGTHIDAPQHVFASAKAIDQVSLATFVGPCRVLNMTHVKAGITVSDLKQAKIKAGERILVKTTNSSRQKKRMINDYIYLTGEAADYVAKVGLTLFGIDYLSIKKRGGNDHRAHTALLKKNIGLIEGLWLKNVKPGIYFFIGLPLLLKGVDGSPIRAILMK